MNIIGTCKKCGEDVDLLQNEINEGIYECPECSHPQTFSELSSCRDENSNENDLLEFKDILEVTKELYSDTLNEDGLKRMSTMIMKMNNLENQVYTYTGMITMMVEDPKVMDIIMKRYRKKFAKA